MVYNWRLRYAPYSSFLPTEHNFGRQTWGREHWKAEWLCVKCLPLRGLVHPRARLEEEEEAKEGPRLVELVGLRTIVLLCLIPLERAISWGDRCVYHYIIRQMTFFHKEFSVQKKNTTERGKNTVSLFPFHFFSLHLPSNEENPQFSWGERRKVRAQIYIVVGSLLGSLELRKDNLILMEEMPRNLVKWYMVGNICSIAMQLVQDQLRSGSWNHWHI